MERIGINLPDSVFTQIQLSQLLVLLEVVYLGYFVVGSMQDFEVLHGGELQTIEVMQIVITHIEHFQAVKAE